MSAPVRVLTPPVGRFPGLILAYREQAEIKRECCSTTAERVRAVVERASARVAAADVHSSRVQEFLSVRRRVRQAGAKSRRG